MAAFTNLQAGAEDHRICPLGPFEGSHGGAGLTQDHHLPACLVWANNLLWCHHCTICKHNPYSIKQNILQHQARMSDSSCSPINCLQRFNLSPEPRDFGLRSVILHCSHAGNYPTQFIPYPQQGTMHAGAAQEMFSSSPRHLPQSPYRTNLSNVSSLKRANVMTNTYNHTLSLCTILMLQITSPV